MIRPFRHALFAGVACLGLGSQGSEFVTSGNLTSGN